MLLTYPITIDSSIQAQLSYSLASWYPYSQTISVSLTDPIWLHPFSEWLIWHLISFAKSFALIILLIFIALRFGLTTRLFYASFIVMLLCITKSDSILKSAFKTVHSGSSWALLLHFYTLLLFYTFIRILWLFFSQTQGRFWSILFNAYLDFYFFMFMLKTIKFLLQLLMFIFPIAWKFVITLDKGVTTWWASWSCSMRIDCNC